MRARRALSDRNGVMDPIASRNSTTRTAMAMALIRQMRRRVGWVDVSRAVTTNLLTAGRVAQDVPDDDHAERHAEQPGNDVAHRRVPPKRQAASSPPQAEAAFSPRQHSGCRDELVARYTFCKGDSPLYTESYVERVLAVPGVHDGG